MYNHAYMQCDSAHCHHESEQNSVMQDLALCVNDATPAGIAVKDTAPKVMRITATMPLLPLIESVSPAVHSCKLHVASRLVIVRTVSR